MGEGLLIEGKTSEKKKPQKKQASVQTTTQNNYAYSVYYNSGKCERLGSDQ